MSSDEFDPYVERLFARTPQMPDATLFAAEVEAKLASGSRVRTLALTVAGLIGGCIAVRESLHMNFNLAAGATPATSRALGHTIQAAGAETGEAIQTMLDQLGLETFSFGAIGGMQLLWITTAALIALAAAGVVKLSQET